MSHYVISDLHGESDRFFRLLDMISFSKEDTLYIIGDVVDRGPDGIRLLKYIKEASNMELIMGNHEHMMMRYLSPDADEKEIRRWNRNGNAPTLHQFGQLSEEDQKDIIEFISTRNQHLEVSVEGKDYYLVHGFPAETLHDEVWNRPKPDDKSSITDRIVVIGHTPVFYMGREEEDIPQYVSDMEKRNEHLHIYHAPHFINIDCGCGYDDIGNVKRLACLRLEDGKEFYA